MVYDGFHTSDLREACAELTVWQRDGIKNRILGGVRLSSGTGECACSEIRYLNMFQKAEGCCYGTQLGFMSLNSRSELWRECQLDGLNRGGGCRVGLHDQQSQLLD